MALTRKMLQAMDIPAEKIDEIINAHTETVDGLKEQLAGMKEDSGKVAKLEKQIGELKKELADADTSDWRQKYDDLKTEYDTFKADIDNKATRDKKEAVYRRLLVDAGISEKRIATILRVSDIDGIELDKDGNPKNVDKLTDSIKEEWADFIPTTHEQGAETAKPPANNGGKDTITKDDILKIKDTAERQQAIREHAELFGIED